MREQSTWWRAIFLALYLAFAILPLYWMLNMSFKTNTEIVSTLTLWPRDFTFEHYRTIFTDPAWYSGYINSLTYVLINTVISLAVALPAAYAFSRYRFIGDKHVFFWLLTNRMTPPAVFLLPFFQLYSSFGLMDTHWPWRWRTWCSTCRWPCDPGGLHVRRAARDRRDRLRGRLFLSAFLPDHLPAPDQVRRGRGGILLLHVQLGRAAAGAHADLGQRRRSSPP